MALMNSSGHVFWLAGFDFLFLTCPGCCWEETRICAGAEVWFGRGVHSSESTLHVCPKPCFGTNLSSCWRSKYNLCVYWFGNLTSWGIRVPGHFYLALHFNTHCVSPSYRSAGSNEIVYGDVSKHFASGSLILLCGSTDHHFINRKAAVYLHTVAKIFWHNSVTSVQFIEKGSLF